MKGAVQLVQARDDLALLTERTAGLEAGLHDRETKLSDARRAATANGSLADVVLCQTYRDAAHGLLEQHRQDVQAARERLADAEQVAHANQLLADSRQMFEVMQRTAQAHDDEATRAEAVISRSLDALAHHADEHRRARLTIRAALQQLPAHRQADWLAQIDPLLTPGDFSPWSGLGLSDNRFPLLVKVGANR